MMQTLITITIVVLLLLQTLSGASAVPAEEQLLLPVAAERVRRNAVCEKVGRIPDYGSTDCKTYYVCTPNTQGSLIAILSQCPSSSVFSFEQLKCVPSASYVCPLTTIEAEQSTTTVTTTTTTTKTPEPAFVCPATGRFANPQSLDCGSYYLCTRNTDGSLIAVVVTCPGTSIFDPDLTSCVLAPHFCAQTPTTTTTETTVVTPGSTVGDGFVCPAEGRYANLDSPDCSRYYLCLESDGVIVANPAICPLSTIFSPIVRQCVDKSSYVCPSQTPAPPIQTTTTTVVTTRTTPTPAPVTTTEVTPQPTFPIIIPTTTTSRPVTTTAATTSSTESTSVTTTEVTPSPTEPQTITIVIPTTTMPTELTTTTEEEEVTSTTTVEVTTVEIDTTPETTSASTAEVTLPESTTTDAESTAATTEQPTETEPTLTTAVSAETTVTDTFESTTEFSEATTDQTEEITTTDTPTTTDVEQTTASETTSEEPATTQEASTTEAESTTEEQPTTEEPTTTDIETSEITTTEPPTTTDASPDIFICPTEGRYPDPQAVACESYILCITNTLGTLTPLTFVCPPTTIFSLIMQMCVPATTYNCAATPTDPPTTVATSTVPATTESVTPKPFVCPAPGRYAKPESIYCKTYYLCLYNAFDILDAVELSCPAGSIFAREVSRCEPDTEYECVAGPAVTTTETLSSTTTTSESTSSVTPASSTATVTDSPATTTKAPFQCNESGKFVNPDSTDCTTYRYCISATGGFTQYTFACPKGALFDPNARDCSGVYVCQVGKEPFVCSAPGKYVNQERNDCKTYKYCITMVNGFAEYLFSCPNGSLYDPNTRLCSATYTCPPV